MDVHFSRVGCEESFRNTAIAVIMMMTMMMMVMMM